MQLSGHIEGLLYMGHQLQLQKLLERLHMVIFKCSTLAGSVLRGKLHLVFSDRVLAAALGPGSSSTVVRNAYISSVPAQPCGLEDCVGVRQLLRPVGSMRLDEDDILHFTARVKGSALFGHDTSEEPVEVCLSLTGEDGVEMRIDGGPWFRLQLLLGTLSQAALTLRPWWHLQALREAS